MVGALGLAIKENTQFGDGSMPYFDEENGYVGVCISQNSWTKTFTVYAYSCTLFFAKNSSKS